VKCHMKVVNRKASPEAFLLFFETVIAHQYPVVLPTSTRRTILF
jgi:hypothetical protein